MTDKSTNSKEEKLEATAKVRMLKTSPQKLNLVSRMIRNKPVNIALAQLKFSKKRIANDVRKCLESAISNAENNHDYNVKVKALLKFIGGGNKVKVSMRFRGREMEHQNLGFDLLKRLTEQVVEHAKVEVHPKSEGRQIMMILVPQIAK